jgi:hypothetical protein
MQLTRNLRSATDEDLATMRGRLTAAARDCEAHLGGDLLTCLHKVVEKVEAEQARRAGVPGAAQESLHAMGVN